MLLGLKSPAQGSWAAPSQIPPRLLLCRSRGGWAAVPVTMAGAQLTCQLVPLMVTQRSGECYQRGELACTVVSPQQYLGWGGRQEGPATPIVPCAHSTRPAYLLLQQVQLQVGGRLKAAQVQDEAGGCLGSNL